MLKASVDFLEVNSSNAIQHTFMFLFSLLSESSVKTVIAELHLSSWTMNNKASFEGLDMKSRLLKKLKK